MATSVTAVTQTIRGRAREYNKGVDMKITHIVHRMRPRIASLRIGLRHVVPLLFAIVSMAVWPALQQSTAVAATSPITLSFDHLTTGFELDGVHRDLPCEACHLNAVFKGTPRDCGTCHTTGSLFNATPKTTTHIPSTNNCAACHNTISFRPDVHFTHAEVLGSCVSCHNGTIAQGEGPKHPKTSKVCEACHTVMSWNPAKIVDHTEIPLAVQGFCIVCHNGVDFSGKSKNHIVTALECGDCHLTTTWLGANFSHVGILTGCSNCHNGVKAVGKQGSHMPTTNLCESCHTTGVGLAHPSWVPSKFDHTQMTVTTCETCHSGSFKISTGFVSGLPVNHVPLPATHLDCGVCHGNKPSAETWDILAASIATLHSGLTVNNCLMCHAGETYAGKPAPYIPMSINGVSPTKSAPLAPPHIPVNTGSDCSACHGAAYQTGGFGPATAMSAAKHGFVSTTCDTCHDIGKSFYTGSGTPLQLRPANHIASGDPRMVSGDCSECHETKDWLSTTLPAGHMPNPGNLTCVTCHTKAPSDYTAATLAALPILHTKITNNCELCHGDYSVALTWANNFTPKDAMLTPAHIPYLSGTGCSSCHTTNYVTGGFGPATAMSAAKHAFVPTACDTCHGAATPTSFYTGTGTPLQIRPTDATHSSGLGLTSDCSACHTTTNWNSTVLPAGHMPNPGSQACTVCHIGDLSTQAGYATLATVTTLHTGIPTGSCAQCHGNYSAALTWFNNFTPKDAMLTPAHIPYTLGTDCSACHASTYATGGFGPTLMSAAKHAFVPTACDTCHGAATPTAFYTGTSTPLQIRPTDSTHSSGSGLTSDCSACHNTTNWNSTVLPVGHMPNPGSQACTVCHIGDLSTQAGYATLASVATLHTGIGPGTCAQCHGNYSAALTWYNNNYTPKSAILTPPHIPYTLGTDCSTCHASTFATGGFGPATMNAVKHGFVPTACDTCHGVSSPTAFYTGTSAALQIRPTNAAHSSGLGLTGDCSNCHNTTNWVTTVLPPGHMPNPGNQTCTVCHVGNLSTQAGYVTLATVATLHTGIATGTCAQCHGNYLAALTWYNNFTPKDAILTTTPHIPYLNGTDCSACHASTYSTGGFGPATTMNPAKHAFVPTTCNTCHDTGKNYYVGSGTALQTRPTSGLHNHLTSGDANQVTGDCSLCHNTTAWTTIQLPVGHMPNPSNLACTVCHTAYPVTSTFASNPVLHTGIANGCAQCHGGATALTFLNTPVAKDPLSASTLSPPHIPSFSNEDCSACHSSATYATGTFGPMNMTQATHSGVGATCNSCHGVASATQFYMGNASPKLQIRPASHTAGQMLTGDCSACHTTANWNSSVLPTGHMPNPGNQVCATCHTAIPTYSTLASFAVLHTGISAGQCSQCHGLAQLSFFNPASQNSAPKSAVLSPSHIPYNAGTDCASCHKTTTYAAGTFGPMNMTQATHAFVSTTCNTCHGVASPTTFYIGAASPTLQIRPADHTTGQMLTGDCSACHTTASWATTTLPSGHMPNPANKACAVCHVGNLSTAAGYATLAANSVLHTGITAGQCAQCHGLTQLSFYNPTSASSKPKSAALTPGHLPYNAGTDCGSCHTSTSYATGTFGPMNMTQALHAFVSTTCNTCHGVASATTFYMGAANPILQIRPADHLAPNGTAQQQTGDCSACHTTANWNSTALPANHMPNPGNQACTTCHVGNLATAAGYATLATNAVLHTGITSGQCSQCHGLTQLSFYNPTSTSSKPKSAVLTPPHIAYNAGTDCGSCHKTTTYATGAFGPMIMSQATHAFVSTTCKGCHGVSSVTAFYTTPSNPLQIRPTTGSHTSGLGLTGDCSACHTTANWSSNTLPTNHMPNPANQACSVCHIAIPTYTTLAAHPVLHTGITSGCKTCHAAPNTTPPVYAVSFTPKSAVLSPPHIPTSSTACESCHTASNFTAFSGTTMSSAKHTTMFAVIGSTCDACHDVATKTYFYGISNLTIRASKSANHNAGKDCGNSGCHNTNTWSVGAQAGAKAKTRSKIATVVAAPATSAAASKAGVAARPPLGRAGFGRLAPAAGPTHAGITGNCVSCHNGVLAASKGTAHIASNNTCENCHTTIAWLPARFDHRGVTASCESCHNGIVAPGKPNKHIQTTQDCSTCHGTVAWTPVNFSHVGVTATCQSCHNGIIATGKQVQHVVTTLGCASCHNTLSWTVVAPTRPALRPLIPKPRSRTASPATSGSAQ